MPQGHRVMKQFPNLSDEPPLEVFRFPEKRDVLEVGVASDVASCPDVPPHCSRLMCCALGPVRQKEGERVVGVQEGI
mgnify:CR=1 FL=1